MCYDDKTIINISIVFVDIQQIRMMYELKRENK